MHDVHYLRKNTLEHLQTGICCISFGDAEKYPGFKIYSGSLEFNKDKCQILSDRCFQNYINRPITSVVIPTYIKQIGIGCFSYDNYIDVVKYMSNAAIPRYTFYNCMTLKHIYIYGKIKNISPKAFTYFEGHYDFKEYTLPNLTIHAKKNSYAHKYAIKFGFKFKELDKNDYCFKRYNNSFYYHLEGKRLKENRERANRFKRKDRNYEMNHKKFIERLNRKRGHL